MITYSIEYRTQEGADHERAIAGKENLQIRSYITEEQAGTSGLVLEVLREAWRTSLDRIKGDGKQDRSVTMPRWGTRKEGGCPHSPTYEDVTLGVKIQFDPNQKEPRLGI